MARTILITILSLFTYSILVAGEDYGFIYPNATKASDQNLVFLLGQEIDIQWNSPFAAIKLAFIAEDGPVFEFFSRKSCTWAFLHHAQYAYRFHLECQFAC
jgi:hypothetical protein